MLEIRRRIIALSEIELRVSQFRTVQPHRDSTVTTVLLSIRADVTKQVIKRSIFVNLRKRRREVIGVEECSPAGVVRQRDQRFLRAKISIVLAQDSSARINGTAAANTAARWGTPSTTRAGGAAAGNDRLESAY